MLVPPVVQWVVAAVAPTAEALEDVLAAAAVALRRPRRGVHELVSGRGRATTSARKLPPSSTQRQASSSTWAWLVRNDQVGLPFRGGHPPARHRRDGRDHRTRRPPHRRRARRRRLHLPQAQRPPQPVHDQGPPAPPRPARPRAEDRRPPSHPRQTALTRAPHRPRRTARSRPASLNRSHR
jgi:hypothetical protein